MVAARVLAIRDRGKRIALGMKQLEVSPWETFARRVHEGAIVRGTVVRTKPFGFFVEVVPGVTGLIHRSETGLAPDQPLAHAGGDGRELAVRVLDIDVGRERLALSRVHPGGTTIALEEGETIELEPAEAAPNEPLPRAPESVSADGALEPGGLPLGRLLRRVLDAAAEGGDHSSSSPT